MRETARSSSSARSVRSPGQSTTRNSSPTGIWERPPRRRPRTHRTPSPASAESPRSRVSGWSGVVVVADGTALSGRRRSTRFVNRRPGQLSGAAVLRRPIAGKPGGPNGLPHCSNRIRLARPRRADRSRESQAARMGCRSAQKEITPSASGSSRGSIAFARRPRRPTRIRRRGSRS